MGVTLAVGSSNSPIDGRLIVRSAAWRMPKHGWQANRLYRIDSSSFTLQLWWELPFLCSFCNANGADPRKINTRRVDNRLQNVKSVLNAWHLSYNSYCAIVDWQGFQKRINLKTKKRSIYYRITWRITFICKNNQTITEWLLNSDNAQNMMIINWMILIKIRVYQIGKCWSELYPLSDSPIPFLNDLDVLFIMASSSSFLMKSSAFLSALLGLSWWCSTTLLIPYLILWWFPSCLGRLRTFIPHFTA